MVKPSALELSDTAYERIVAALDPEIAYENAYTQEMAERMTNQLPNRIGYHVACQQFGLDELADVGDRVGTPGFMKSLIAARKGAHWGLWAGYYVGRAIVNDDAMKVWPWKEEV